LLFILRQDDKPLWLGGNAINYLPLSKGQVVPADGWRWLTSGRIIDLPKEVWTTGEPTRFSYSTSTDSYEYESCINLNGARNGINDERCNNKMSILCQKIVEEEDKIIKNDQQKERLLVGTRSETIHYVGRTFRSNPSRKTCSTPTLPKKIYYLDATEVNDY
jgi:hypothetical protein